MKLPDSLAQTIRLIQARYEPEELRLLSQLYWRVLLGVAFLVLVLIFFYSSWVLVTILDDLSAVSNTSMPTPSVLNRTTLSATVRAFDARKAHFDELKASGGTTITDPSR